MSKVVLDASALLAMLNQEPGGEEVENAIPGAVIGTVNLSEVAAKLQEGGMPSDLARSILDGVGLDVQPFDSNLAYRTGALRGPTRKLGLSLGDRACLALGELLDLPVLTTDRAWRDVQMEIEVRVIR